MAKKSAGILIWKRGDGALKDGASNGCPNHGVGKRRFGISLYAFGLVQLAGLLV